VGGGGVNAIGLLEKQKRKLNKIEFIFFNARIKFLAIAIPFCFLFVFTQLDIRFGNLLRAQLIFVVKYVIVMGEMRIFL
jgi:hypothetical protein